MAAMIPFDRIRDAAEARAGGAEALAGRLPVPKSEGELRATGDDRYLSLMSRRIFRACLKHALVDRKWPAFEEVFMGFEPKRVRAISDEALEALLCDGRLIRHWPKLKAVRANAAAMCALAEERGSFGAYLAEWPGGCVVDLWADLARRFAQMGGNSGPYFLRMAGKDTFLLSGDVVRALNHWGVIEGEPKGKGGRARVEAAFNGWHEATAKPLTHLSMIVALSVP